MRVLILAGGQGTRLLPLTKYIPKTLVSIHGQPFLYYLLRWLKKHDVVISVGYHRNAIKNWCKENKLIVEFVEENTPLGTGGAIRQAKPFFKNNRKFAVINGDTFLDEDLSDIAKTHSGIATAVIAPSVLDGTVRNAGIYIFSNKIFKTLDRPYAFSLEDRLKCVEHNIYHSKSHYLDIGTHEGLKYAKESKVFRGVRWEKE